jgi:hypothetical protein
MNKAEWIAEIKSVAVREFGFSALGVHGTDWNVFWEAYGAYGMTPIDTLESTAVAA